MTFGGQGYRSPTLSCLARGAFFLGAACLTSHGQVVATAKASDPAMPPSITLEQAIALAKANEPSFASALAASRVSELDRSIARAALLPNVTYHNQFLYTQAADGRTQSSNVGNSSSGVTSTPRFIANNAVHEYTSLGTVNETIGLGQATAVAHATAAAAVAAAELEIARRGLVTTVVGLFYSVISADRKLAVAERAFQEAGSFTDLTQKRESAREVAHADAIKAQLQQQQRERDLGEARLLVQKVRLELGVLLFPDPRSTYSLSASSNLPAMPSREEVIASGTHLNPEVQSALFSLRGNDLDVTAARAAYLPDLALNFSYGIDAPQFATRGPDGVHNLGYSASATLDIPIWDWLSTQHKVRQSQILRDAARTTLSATQRRLVAQIEEDYAESSQAQSQLASLDLSVATAQESLRLTRLRYTAGEATVLEVVDAQNSLTSAELAREDGIVRYDTSLANLQLLTGTL